MTDIFGAASTFFIAASVCGLQTGQLILWRHRRCRVAEAAGERAVRAHVLGVGAVAFAVAGPRAARAACAPRVLYVG